jgi:hypothetical protein
VSIVGGSCLGLWSGFFVFQRYCYDKVVGGWFDGGVPNVLRFKIT